MWTLLTVFLVDAWINAAKYSCPFWFSPVAKALIDKILDPNPKTVSSLLHYINLITDLGLCPGN
jgi:hypothetical protein